MRTALQPGDVGAIVAMHGLVYAEEYGFDTTFEAYVAGPLAEFVLRGSPRERIWIEERDGGVGGCVAIVEAGPGAAPLRWFLVHPLARGTGPGRGPAVRPTCGGVVGVLLTSRYRHARRRADPPPTGRSGPDRWRRTSARDRV